MNRPTAAPNVWPMPDHRTQQEIMNDAIREEANNDRRNRKPTRFEIERHLKRIARKTHILGKT